MNSKQMITVIKIPTLEMIIGRLNFPEKLKNKNKKTRKTNIAEY